MSFAYGRTGWVDHDGEGLGAEPVVLGATSAGYALVARARYTCTVAAIMIAIWCEWATQSV